MTTYVRITTDGLFDRLVDVTAEQYAQLQANGKAAWLRLWMVDPKPAPGASEVVVVGPVVIDVVDARQTWVLRPKTQAELDAEANGADRPTLQAMVSAITADLDAFIANPDVSGTAVERLTKLEARVKDLERQQRRDNRILRYYLRSQQ